MTSQVERKRGGISGYSLSRDRSPEGKGGGFPNRKKRKLGLEGSTKKKVARKGGWTRLAKDWIAVDTCSCFTYAHGAHKGG